MNRLQIRHLDGKLRKLFRLAKSVNFGIQHGFERDPGEAMLLKPPPAYEAFGTDATGDRGAYREFVSRYA